MLFTFFHADGAERDGLKKPQTPMGQGIEAFRVDGGRVEDVSSWVEIGDISPVFGMAARRADRGHVRRPGPHFPANSAAGAIGNPVLVMQQTPRRRRSGPLVASRLNRRKPVHEGHEPLDQGELDLVRSKPEDAPTAQARLQILLQIRVEPGGPVVPTIDPDSPLNLDKASRRQMRKIGPPTPLGVEAVFPLQLGASCQPPESKEGFFEAGAWSFGAEAEAGH